MKKLLTIGLVVAGSLAAGGTAFAGEITGGGPDGSKETPIKSEQDCEDPDNGDCPAPAGPAKSECAFSGLNDEYIKEGIEKGGTASDGFGRTQSWGRLPKEVRDQIGPLGAHPGQSCNPAKGTPVEP